VRGHNEGTVFRHKKRGLWCACVTSRTSGKAIRKYRYAKTQKQALELLRELQNELEAGKLNDPNRLLLKDYLAWWLENIAEPNYRYASWRYYTGLANNHVVPAIGACRINQLKAHHVDELLQSVKSTKSKRSGSPRLRQQIYDFLKKVLATAVRRGTLARSVCDAVDRPNVPKTEISTLSEAQAAVLLKTARTDRFFALYTLDLNSGLRWGELAGLRWRDIDALGGMISLQRALITAKSVNHNGVLKERPVVAETKSGRGRHVAVPEFVIRALQEHKERMAAEGHLEFVFCDTKGGPLRRSNFFRRSFQPLLKKVNEQLPSAEKLPHRFRFHDLRHTHATFLLKAGVHPKIVSERLGHSTVAITLDVYSHVLPSMQRPAVDAMNRIFRAKTNGAAVFSAVLRPPEEAKA
jgi:integrase